MDATLELLLLLPVTALANWQAIETYHHGSIFVKSRAYWEARGGFLGDLMTCPFCLGHWTAACLTMLVFLLVRNMLQTPIWNDFSLFFWPAYWLAVVRLSQFFNDRFYSFCRTVRETPEDKKAFDALGKINYAEEMERLGKEIEEMKNGSSTT